MILLLADLFKKEIELIMNPPNILGTIRCDNDGNFTHIHTPHEFHEEGMLTFIPKQNGIYIVLGHYREDKTELLAQFIETIFSRLN